MFLFPAVLLYVYVININVGLGYSIRVSFCLPNEGQGYPQPSV